MTTATHATSRARFLGACRGEKTLPVPVWLMRQAGRYLEEYRQLRAGAEFLRVCKSPELATEATLQPMRRFALDAAIVFSDIMLPVEPLGMHLAYEPGPIIDPPLRTRADIDRLGDPEPGEGLEFIADAVRHVRRALSDDRALIGFAGAPVTLAMYMCEGRGSRDFARFRALARSDPRATHTLLARLARVTAGTLRRQIEAGADAVQLFDTWAGHLDPGDFETLVVPYVREIAAELAATGAPVIYFARKTQAILKHLPQVGAQVYGLDDEIDLRAARRVLGATALQGNLDPTLLLGDPGVMKKTAIGILEAGGGEGHVFNLGHGVLRDTPPDHVGLLVETVRGWKPGSDPLGAP